MSLCKAKQIQNCCHPNAIITLKEYLEDYAAPETKELGEALIARELDNVPKEKIRTLVGSYLSDIHNGARDFRI
jgi:2-iminoacetate synthase